MASLLFRLRTPTGDMYRKRRDDLEINDARGIRAHARAMAAQAIDAGADVDDLTVQVVHEEPTRADPVVAVLNCYRLVNLPM